MVARVYPDGDLRVNIEGKTWTFNPLCVSLAPRTAEYNNTMRANERQEHAGELGEACNILYLSKFMNYSFDLILSFGFVVFGICFFLFVLIVNCPMIFVYVLHYFI